MRDVQDHLVRTVEMVELYRDLILGARDLYLSTVNNNLNAIMKALTMISVVGLPLTVVTSFFGMNFEQITTLSSPWAFWGAVAFMFILVGVLLTWFRHKNWI